MVWYGIAYVDGVLRICVVDGIEMGSGMMISDADADCLFVWCSVHDGCYC